MNIYLDDETEDVRPTPEGFIRCRWPEEVIEHLKTGQVKIVSLDHDLGCDERTGYDVCLWIEQEVVLHEFQPPTILIHSANPVGIARMRRSVEFIKRYTDK